MQPLAKAALWVGGASLVASVGAALWMRHKATVAAAALPPSPAPTAPLLPPPSGSSASVMPELPAGTPTPFKVFTTADNGATVSVPNGSRIDVVLPDLRASGLTWTSSHTGVGAALVSGGFDLYLLNSSQTSFSGIAQGGPLYVSSFMVNGPSGSSMNLRYDLKNASNAIQSTLLINLTLQ